MIYSFCSYRQTSTNFHHPTKFLEFLYLGLVIFPIREILLVLVIGYISWALSFVFCLFRFFYVSAFYTCVYAKF